MEGKHSGRENPTSGRRLGGGKAHRLAPVTPLAFITLLFYHVVLRHGHLDAQPGLVAGTGA